MVLKRAPKKNNYYESDFKRENNEYSYNSKSSNKEGKTSGKEIAIAIACVLGFILLCVIGSSSNNSSSTSSSYSTSKSNTNDYEKDGKCRGNDGYWHDKPAHGYCDGGDTPLGWKCNVGYSAKSENDTTWVNSSRYCAANCRQFSCSQYYNCNTYENNIPKYVNNYSQSSINTYNRAVEAYNRCLSERCSCKY